MSISTSGQKKSARLGRPQLSAGRIWDAVTRQSFAVISHVTPAGAPRSSGVVYAVSAGRMYVAVAQDSWKARQISTNGVVAVTVPVRRGGLLSLLAPIPPATVSFPAVATVHPGTDPAGLPSLRRLIPPERRSECVLLEIRPTGYYVTYGLGVPLRHMRDTTRSHARVRVS
jgi:hypothetical protein